MANVTSTTIANWLPTHYLPTLQYGTIEKSVLAPLVKRPDLEGFIINSGNAIVMGTIGSDTARDKVVNTAITYDENTEGKITLNLNKHKYLAHIIEKRAEIQSLPAVLKNYAIQDVAGLAKAMDVSTGVLIQSLTQNVGALNSAATAYGDISDVVIRNAIQLLDEAEAPEENRYLIVSPAQKNALLGIDKFVDASKFGSDRPVTKGFFGEIYGVMVFISNNLPDTASSASVSGGAPLTVKRKDCVMLQSDCIALAVQADIDTMLEPSADHIGTKMVTDVLYGHVIYRDLYGVNVRVTSE